ncbi:flagellar biosynthetic protein FliQ [bacterium]|jgi:flagellar biosynthesis protein FliQ|nr:flagellar biosynthetic protein FliQ [bacterium]
MNPDFAVEIIRLMMFKAVSLAAPILGIGMSVGLSVSVFQAVTSINEQTLSFVPKTMSIVTFLVVATPWILRTLMEFSTVIIQLIPQMAA